MANGIGPVIFQFGVKVIPARSVPHDVEFSIEFLCALHDMVCYTIYMVSRFAIFEIYPKSLNCSYIDSILFHPLKMRLHCLLVERGKEF